VAESALTSCTIGGEMLLLLPTARCEKAHLERRLTHGRSQKSQAPCIEGRREQVRRDGEGSPSPRLLAQASPCTAKKIIAPRVQSESKMMRKPRSSECDDEAIWPVNCSTRLHASLSHRAAMAGRS
jgi:hypothetical protein